MQECSNLRKSGSDSIFKQALQKKKRTEQVKVVLESHVDHEIQLENNMTPSFSIDKNPCFDEGQSFSLCTASPIKFDKKQSENR